MRAKAWGSAADRHPITAGPARLAAGLGESRSAHRLQVEQGPFEPIIEEAQSELLALRTALGD
jgi:hypothetical protein